MPVPNRNLVQDLKESKSRRRFLQTLAGAGVFSLAGCTGDGDPSGTQDNTTEENGNQGPEDDEVLSINTNQRFGTIDPSKGTDWTQISALVNLYEPLTFPDSEGEIQAYLANDWTISDDNQTYTFEIREEATFHNGDPVTAEDVTFSVKRLMEINQGYSSLFKGVVSPENVTAKGEKTVEFVLSKPYSPFLAVLTLLFIVNKDVVTENQEEGDFGEFGDYGQSYLTNHDAGSGPYALDEFERGSHLALKAQEDYWMGWPSGSFKKVRMEVVKEESTVKSLIKEGSLDMTSHYQSKETYDALSEGVNDVKVIEVPTVQMFYMKINTQKPPTDDIKVRKAIAYGFDYESVLNEIAPYSKPAKGPLSTEFKIHKEDIHQPTYDPEKAKQILEDAGYSEGELKIENIYMQNMAVEEKMGLLFQENMAEIGIDVELNPQTWATMTNLASSAEKTPHVSQVFYPPVYPSPYAVFYNQYHSEASNSWVNMEHLENDEVDQLIDKARETVDTDKQAQIYKEIQEKIAGLYPDLFVFIDTYRYAMDSDLKGFTYRPAMSFQYRFHDMYL